MAKENVSNSNTAVIDTSDREIVVTRLLNAPRALVFEAWTKPEHVEKWWGPTGFTITTKEIAIKPGGVWRFTMHGPDGVDYPNKIVYKEIVEPEYITYFHSGDDNVHDVDFSTTITFEARGNKTFITLRSLFPNKEYLERVVRDFGAIEGAKQHVAKMEAYIANMPPKEEFRIVRTFNAPLDLVWKAHSEAEHLAKWWGPVGFELKVAKLDVRPGGMFLYSMDSPQGTMWGRFVYREVSAPNKMVFVISFSNAKGEIVRAPFSDIWPLEVLNIIELTEENGKTTLTLTGGPINATDEEREAYRKFFGSMQEGFKGTYDQLETYLNKVSK